MTRARNNLLAAAGILLLVAGATGLAIFRAETPTAEPADMEHAIGHFQREQYDTVLAILRDLPEDERDDWRVPYYTGATLIKLKDYEAAVSVLEQARLMNPGEADIPFALGVAYFKLGNLALAKGYFASVVEIDPGHEEARGLVDAMANLERMQPDKTEETGN